MKADKELLMKEHQVFSSFLRIFSFVILLCGGAFLSVSVHPSSMEGLQLNVSRTKMMLNNKNIILDEEKQDRNLTLLYSSQEVFRDVSFAKDVVISGSGDKDLFYLLGADKRLVIYDSKHRLSRILGTNTEDPDSIAVDDEGRIYVADLAGSQIKVLSQKGEILKTFSVHSPISFGVLSNGNIVVASPFNGWLLHLYDSSGREIRSFGRIKKFGSIGESQNNFLNRGKVVIDSSDTIYYVSKFAPIPTVQRFSRRGNLISEFVITGKAIEIQLEVAQQFLGNIPSTKAGGITVVNSAAIDPQSNHLLVCMNGSSDSGVVYEYKPNGKKLREFSFLIDSPSLSKTVISINQVLAWSSHIYIFTANGKFRVDVNQPAPSGRVEPQATCPAEQPFNDCGSNCNTPAVPEDDLNCKSELLSSIDMQGKRIISTVCNQSNTSCLAQVELCKISNGVKTTHNIQLDCGSGGGGGCEQLPPIDGCGNCYEWDWDVCGCVYVGCSPVVVDVLGNGFDLTGLSDGVDFDLNADGIPTRYSWTAPASDDAWLVLDRNGNGLIDNGRELFGSYTAQPASPSPNGFIALAEFDKPENGGNNDGRINSQDAIFSSLRLWQDTNHNGVSEPGELHPLLSLGLAAIDLDYKVSRRTDPYGNVFRYRAKVRDTRGAQLGRWAWDVFLLSR
ncbi:MAG: hypothetical protein AB1631_13890 [Acidobacteriota bacterium]